MYDAERYEVIRNGDGSYAVIDKQDTNHLAIFVGSHTAAHKTAREWNVSHRRFLQAEKEADRKPTLVVVEILDGSEAWLTASLIVEKFGEWVTAYPARDSGSGYIVKAGERISK